jgi:hypothetical protein
MGKATSPITNPRFVPEINEVPFKIRFCELSRKMRLKYGENSATKAAARRPVTFRRHFYQSDSPVFSN